MKVMTKTILASALLAALPVGNALACQTTAWNGGATNAATANGPATGDSRYAGACALEVAAAGNSYVTDNSPNGETDYRARFYVFTGTATGAPVIFRAGDADNGGAAVVEITYDAANGQFDFASGAAAASANGIAPSKWYSIEFYYDAGTAITANVQGAGSATAIPVSFGTAPSAATIGSARLGAVTGGTALDTMRFDEFESTRSTTTAIGRLCRGDANNSGGISAIDRTSITQELALPPVVAPGQPDCNEDGRVSAIDRTCVTEKLAIFDPAAQCQ